MPRSLDFFVPCRRMTDQAAPAEGGHHPWRTASGDLMPGEPMNPSQRPDARRSTGRTIRPVVTSGGSAGSGGSVRPVRPSRLAGPASPVKRSSPARRARRRGPLFGRLLRGGAVLATAALLGCLVAFPDVRQAAAAVLPGATPEQAFGRDQVRILLLGADMDYDEQGRRVKSSGRSDTLILANLDLVDRTAHLCSIPRDTEAEIPGHGERRINSAYAYGGADLARRSVEDLTGLEIDHTVVVNLEAFKEAVDALGGVDIEVEKPLRYTDNWAGLNIDIPAGRQRLDGERAMQFVRFRHDALADIGRARRQQAFMRALGEAMRRPSAVVAWPGVVRAVSRNTETDLTPAQMVALGRFAKDMDQMTTETLPGSFHGSRWRPDSDEVRRMAARLSD